MPVPASRLASAPRPHGRYDILLTRASVNSLIRHLRASGVAIERRSDLDAAIAGHGAEVAEWLEDCAEALVPPLLSAACVLDVQTIVLDGDLPKAVIEDLISRLTAALAAATPEPRDVPEVRMGTIGRRAAAIGAAILPLHLNYSPNLEILLGQ
jgi:predicted NBD/HSP70 family sugar kinase